MNLPMIPFPKLLCHAHRSHSLMAAEAQKAQQSQTSRDFTRGRSPKRRGLRARGLTMPHPSTNTTNTTAILQQYTLRYRTYNFHAWTSFHQLPPISTRKQLPRPLWEDCNQLQVLQTAFGCSQDLRFSRLEFLEKSLQFKT